MYTDRLQSLVDSGSVTIDQTAYSFNLWNETVWILETNCGTESIPVSVCDVDLYELAQCEDTDEREGTESAKEYISETFSDYIEGNSVTSWERVDRWLSQWSMPGYMDQGSLNTADTETEAISLFLDDANDGEEGRYDDTSWEALERLAELADSGDSEAEKLLLWHIPQLEEDEPEEDEPEEEDYILSPCGQLGGKTRVSQYGKILGEFVEESDAREFVREHMDRGQYWPNVWKISDHGNAILISV